MMALAPADENAALVLLMLSDTELCDGVKHNLERRGTQQQYMQIYSEKLSRVELLRKTVLSEAQCFFATVDLVLQLWRSQSPTSTRSAHLSALIDTCKRAIKGVLEETCRARRLYMLAQQQNELITKNMFEHAITGAVRNYVEYVSAWIAMRTTEADLVAHCTMGEQAAPAPGAAAKLAAAEAATAATTAAAKAEAKRQATAAARQRKVAKQADKRARLAAQKTTKLKSQHKDQVHAPADAELQVEGPRGRAPRALGGQPHRLATAGRKAVVIAGHRTAATAEADAPAGAGKHARRQASAAAKRAKGEVAAVAAATHKGEMAAATKQAEQAKEKTALIATQADERTPAAAAKRVEDHAATTEKRRRRGSAEGPRKKQAVTMSEAGAGIAVEGNGAAESGGITSDTVVKALDARTAGGSGLLVDVTGPRAAKAAAAQRIHETIAGATTTQSQTPTLKAPAKARQLVTKRAHHPKGKIDPVHGRLPARHTPRAAAARAKKARIHGVNAALSLGAQKFTLGEVIEVDGQGWGIVGVRFEAKIVHIDNKRKVLLVVYPSQFVTPDQRRYYSDNIKEFVEVFRGDLHLHEKTGMDTWDAMVEQVYDLPFDSPIIVEGGGLDRVSE
ncbi:hypothetical protein JKP88DRAFT_266596 [Tribonema minus]|uniref:Uncharacterized protein n=1 Tax=Tribonema minus TaxID=303371 RepID=A0A835ZFS1_9STRA|nr:hypothetical protein JKP88DRAFT_266596 [Tribonema minus]